MPYTTNPKMPKLRAKAVNLVILEGWSIRQVARHFGFNPSTISKWVKKIKGRSSRKLLQNFP